MIGNALVGQSGGPTAVINSSLRGVIDASQAANQVGNLYGMRFGIEGFLESSIVDFARVPQSQLELLQETPSSALGSCRYKLADDDLEQVLSQIKKYDIRYLVMIGGNDTMDTIHRIEKYARETNYELFGVGVPKTVDNDLFGTDHTPGFPSAARYVALSVQQSARLAADMQRVDKFVVHQTVGRDAGWLASASAATKHRDGDAPHIVLVPERPISRGKLLDRAQNTIDRFGWLYIVVGEGALWENRVPISASMTEDQFSNIEFGAMGGSSAALQIHALLSQELAVRGEFQITESLPMCASDRVSSVDRNEAYQCGVKAVEMATSSVSGSMVTIDRKADNPYRVEYGTIALSKVAVRTRPMPDEFLGEGGTDISQLYRTYLDPLIEQLPTYADLRSE